MDAVAFATLDVEYRGITYTFKVPTPFDQIRIAKRAQTLRADASVDGFDSSGFGLDRMTIDLLNGMAVFEVLLQNSTHAWPRTERDGKIVVDSKAFPPSKTMTVVEVYNRYTKAVDRFLQDGDGRDEPPVSEGVVGEPGRGG